MKIDWNSRTTRRTTAAAIALAALLVVVPSIFQQHSFNAIINTRFVAVHSPIEGVVSDFKLQPGDAVDNNELIARVQNIRLNSSFVKELQVERNSLKERIHGYNLHIDEMTALKQELEQRNSDTQVYEKDRVAQQLAEAEALLNATRQILAEKTEQERRLAPLAKERLIKLTDFDTIRFAVIEYRNRVAAAEATVARIKTEQAALERNIQLGQGRNDVPYTQQRIDEVRMIISDYRARKVEQESRVTEIDRQIAAEESRLALNREVELRSPLKGILWKKFFANGSEIQIGNEVAQVIDCSQLFIDAEINEKKLEQLTLGQTIQYRLIGSTRWLTGSLISKTGSGNTLQDRTLAAKLTVEADSARLTIKINPDDLDRNSGDFCHVGRKVEVSMPRTWLKAVGLTRITGLFQ